MDGQGQPKPHERAARINGFLDWTGQARTDDPAELVGHWSGRDDAGGVSRLTGGGRRDGPPPPLTPAERMRRGGPAGGPYRTNRWPGRAGRRGGEAAAHDTRPSAHTPGHVAPDVRSDHDHRTPLTPPLRPSE